MLEELGIAYSSRVISLENGEREPALQAEIDVRFTVKGGGTDVRLVHTVKRAQDWHRRIGDGWNQALKALDDLFARPEIGQ